MSARKGVKPAKVKAPLDPQLATVFKARGERMAAVRELAGFDSQLAASQVARVDSGTISELERGLKDLYLTTAERLADAYRVSLDTLVGRAPLPTAIDKYPARDPLLRSPEFERLPKAVTDRFVTTEPDGAERWSTLQWARVLLDLEDTYRRHGALPPPAEGDEARRLRPAR